MYFLRHVRSSSERKVIEHTALQFVKFMAYKSSYLNFKPSHQAAVVSVLTVNLFLSPAAVTLGLARSADSIVELQKEIRTGLRVEAKNPLSIWSEEIEVMSLISKSEMVELYSQLLQHLDTKQFKNKLQAFPDLWMQ